MNILIIHNYYKHRGGEDHVYENESRALKNSGHNVIKYTRHNNETDNYSFWGKLNFIFSSISNKKTIKDIKEIIKKNQIDIAHIHNVFPFISPCVYKYLKKQNIKVVQTIHNYRFLCPNGLFYRNNMNCQLCIKGNFFHCVIHRCFKNSFILSCLYAYIIKHNQRNFRKNINAYIALTEYSKEIFINAGFLKEKFYVKDNGFFDNNIKRKKSAGFFLYLGRISKEKGIDFLLESFIKLPQYKLIVAGTGPKIEEYKKRYNNPNIQFTGFVDGDKKNSLIQEAESLIIPSVCFDNYPISIVEAFSCGIPVIGSKIGGIPFIIEHDKNGLLFEVNDFYSLKDRLQTIHNNRKLREKMGNYARETFLKRMEFTNNIKKLEEIYRGVLNE